jgi:hypothetical protein
MSVTPTWLAATAGHQGNSGFVNQLLGSHTATFLYQGGVLKSSQGTGTAVFTTTQGQYLDQAFSTVAGQTSVGSVGLQISTVGGSPTLASVPSLVLGIYADSSGVPTGSALASVLVSVQYIYDSSFWVSIPLAVSGLTASTRYHLVTSPVGTSTNYYVWQRSNQVTGTTTSTDGISWTSQSYGLMYQIYDETSSGLLNMIYEDNGARWSVFSYNSTGQIQTIDQYTVAQGSSYVQSFNTLSYTNGLLTGVI